jgi:hypothetical protein
LLAANLASGRPAGAVPREIVILRHGEKQDPYALCSAGIQRSLALRANYLGKGAANSLFSPGGGPAAFFSITLHSLEVIAPAAASWGLPVIDYSVVPLKHIAGVDEEQELDERTRQAANDILTSPQWDGKVVVVAWEHKHIASAKLTKHASEQVTLRELLHLDRLAAVPKTWSGSNYDYFWIVNYRAGSAEPVAFRTVKQTYSGEFAALPQNDWEQPAAVTAAGGCE